MTVMERYRRDVKEHLAMMKSDPYYAFSCGGITIPEPSCRSCMAFNPEKECCTKDWNNAEEDYYIPDRDDKDHTDLCDDYELNEGWEDE